VQCRAIIGEQDGDRGQALVCALPVTVRLNGLPSSWCAHHYKVYTLEPKPARPERSFVFKQRKPSSRQLSTAEA
jgi:hypothetical protein